MRLVSLFLAFILGFNSLAYALPCEQSKSAFIDAISNDSINLVRETNFNFGDEVSITTPVGPNLLQRSAGQVIFKTPGTGDSLKTAMVTISVPAFDNGSVLLQFVTGPIINGFASCSERIFGGTATVINDINSPQQFDLNTLGANDGDTSFIIDALGSSLGGPSVTPFGLTFDLKVKPGQEYEAACGAIAEKGERVESFTCNIKVEIDNEGSPAGSMSTSSSSSGSNISNELIKITPEVTDQNCPFTAIEHLNFAARIEQALKSRLSAISDQIQNAIDEVSNAGINPGPALRRLDALIELIRGDVASEAVKASLRTSKRHLECAKQKTDNENAKSAIDLAIADDNDAISEIMKENVEIKNESVRIKGTLDSTLSRINSALGNKTSAGANLDPGYSLPDFGNENVSDIVNESVGQLENLIDGLKQTLSEQGNVVQESGLKKGSNIICGAQKADCIEGYFDDLALEYVKIHTAVRQILKEKEEELKKLAEEDKKKALEAKQAEAVVRKIDIGYSQIVQSTAKTKKEFEEACFRLPDSIARQRKIRSLLELRRRASLVRDKQWLRLIDKALEKIGADLDLR
ncbi:MAG: hypothetical protein HYZ79_06940 [Candidatus Melainabacteria bacterium]|nr:hypothetical protein [Candidatus Melainabacteria bacterium]